MSARIAQLACCVLSDFVGLPQPFELSSHSLFMFLSGHDQRRFLRYLASCDLYSFPDRYAIHLHFLPFLKLSSSPSSTCPVYQKDYPTPDQLSPKEIKFWITYLPHYPDRSLPLGLSQSPTTQKPHA